MTTLPAYAVTVYGHPGCPCQAAWLPVFEVEARRRGLLVGPLPVSQLIGGDPRSGGTHVDGGAADFFPLTAITDIGAFVALAREMGADATFERLFNWDGHDGVHHVHSVLTGCPHNAPARYQIDAVRAGFNGLGAGGRGAPDTGPRPLSDRTWRQGIEWAKQQEEDDMALSDADKAWIQKTVNDAVEAGFNKKLPNGRSLRAVVQLLAARAGVSDKARRK
jgi:hypothetical protein